MSDLLDARSRLTIYPLAVIVALVLGVVAGSSVADRQDEAYSGDYPAFYGAGRIAADGDWDHLYDLDRQIEAQAELSPKSEQPTARFYAYPPQVAFAYQPLAGIDFYWSYLIHTALMGLLLLGALLLSRPMLPWLRNKVALAMAAALLFWPMFRTVTGGSNTALTLFLIVAAWRLIHEEQPWAAGLVLAGLSYKPQFILPMVGLFLLGRYWRVVAGAAIGGGVFFVAGVLLRGGGWVAEWLDVASEFGRIDADVNGHSAISFVGFAENLFGTDGSPAVLVAGMLSAATVALLAWLWWRSPGADLDRLLAITMPGILLLSLHAMSHDGAVIVLTAAVAVGIWERRRWMPWVVTIWMLGAIQILIKQIGWSPGFPMLLLAMWWGWQILHCNRPTSGSPAS